MRQRSSYGWLELVIGILLSVLGIYSFFRPVDYLTTLIVIYGIAALPRRSRWLPVFSV